tara:strand:- start:3622 stop:4011 length:390 start_codon:yes stop_codon:yes gene_type:complete
MEDMKLEIRGFLENNTDQANLWISLQEMYRALNPHTNLTQELSEEEERKGLLFSETLVHMINDREIRLDKKDNDTYTVALESFIQDKISGTKKSAIEEMEDELRKYVKLEDFEKAAEYRDMIIEYKEKL